MNAPHYDNPWDRWMAISLKQARQALLCNCQHLADTWLEIAQDVANCRAQGMNAEVFASALIDAASDDNRLAKLAAHHYAA